MVRLIVEQQVTTLHFVPSMLKVFLDERGLAACTSLKRVICSGEALSSELRDRFFGRLDAELHNLYGPTEAAVDVTYWDCQSEPDRPVVPIGRPIANIQIYILDAYLQPVPVGVTGELHIGGIGLARGYLNRPELTAEKFIRIAISQLSTSNLLYKTGDLARFLPDGNIEYLGRLDFQVKIRGFRIELEEIEAVLTRHPALRAAAVLIREDLPGDKRLVGYIVPEQEPGPNVSELRGFLKDKLPDYMAPAVFITMKAMPLTANGKVDRRALPVPEGVRPELTARYVAPRCETERTIAAIWKQVLQVEKVGMNDSFFDLGGHSLLMVQVHGKLQEVFKKDLSVMELFQYPTVSSLAEFLIRGKDGTAVLQHENRVEKMKEGKDRLKQQLKRKQSAAKRGEMSR
jgi:acyl carrier protein